MRLSEYSEIADRARGKPALSIFRDDELVRDGICVVLKTVESFVHAAAGVVGSVPRPMPALSNVGAHSSSMDTEWHASGS